MTRTYFHISNFYISTSGRHFQQSGWPTNSNQSSVKDAHEKIISTHQKRKEKINRNPHQKKLPKTCDIPCQSKFQAGWCTLCRLRTSLDSVGQCSRTHRRRPVARVGSWKAAGHRKRTVRPRTVSASDLESSPWTDPVWQRYAIGWNLTAFLNKLCLLQGTLQSKLTLMSMLETLHVGKCVAQEDTGDREAKMAQGKTPTHN